MFQDMGQKKETGTGRKKEKLYGKVQLPRGILAPLARHIG